MKNIGIIGGIAPASTMEYYRLIIGSYRAQKPDGSYPALLINSMDLTRMMDLIGAQKLTELSAYLLGEIMKLARAGAEVGLFASNTPHIVFEDIQRHSPIPLISIVEATSRVAARLGLKSLGLLGTRFTMQARFFPDVFSRQGMQVIVPALEDQDFIHEKYMSELVNGIYLNETRERFLEIVERLREEAGVEGLILGGTELPFLLKDVSDEHFPLLNTTRIHVDEIVTHMLA
jgi:aspartate racemase